MPGRRKKNFKTFSRTLKHGSATTYDLTHGEENFFDNSNADETQSEIDVDTSEREQRIEEQHKFGIFFDDDYDYMKHLKDVKDFQECSMKETPQLFQLREEDDEDIESQSEMSAHEPHLLLPESEQGLEFATASASASEPGPDWDPEIVAALEDDFDYDDPDNVLEDNFMDFANGDEDDSFDAEEEGLNKNFNRMHVEKEDALSDEACHFSDDEFEEDDEEEEDDHEDFRGTELQDTLTQQTKALIEREYGMEQIGALDFEPLDGRVTFESDLFKQASAGFLKSQQMMTMKEIVDSEDRVRPQLPESYYYVDEKDEKEEEADEVVMESWLSLFDNTPKPEFDSQSIISTYSRTRNLPTVVDLPEELRSKKKKKNKKATSEQAESETVSNHGMPGLTLRELDRQMREHKSADTPSTYRVKGESTEERKERKKALKEHMRERRIEKKETKMAFRKEMLNQRKQQEANKKVLPLVS